MIYNSDKPPTDYDDELLVCPRCKNPVSVLPDVDGRSEVYFCYHCTREVDPIEDDDGVEESRDWRPEFEMAPTWGTWTFAVGLLILVLVTFCRSTGVS
jgi:hypothetical protein